MAELNFDDWLRQGYEAGFCGPAVCATHDGTPMSDEEVEQFDEGGEPCLHILRLYEDAAAKEAVEDAHSPSVWRATNAGLKD